MVTSIQGISSFGVTVSPTTSDGSQQDSSQNSPAPEQKSLSQDQIQSIVQELNTAMQSFTSDLEFSIDNTTKQTVVKVIDTNTNQVIRQIPSEEMLRVSQRIAELLGVLYDHTA